MPDKEGSDDEKKSTKSVVNKKQKQMMGEEGYDIARDMGKVRPSKDKKDATTMPVSKEMRKTQKVNKGPSALELVKKKYGKAVMNVGKKKANEELDLTQVAEAFGGYIIESRPKIVKRGKKTIIAPGKGEEKAEQELVTKKIEKQLKGQEKVSTEKPRTSAQSLTRGSGFDATERLNPDDKKTQQTQQKVANQRIKSGKKQSDKAFTNEPIDDVKIPSEVRDPKTGETLTKDTPPTQQEIERKTKEVKDQSRKTRGSKEKVTRETEFISDPRKESEAPQITQGKGDGRKAGRRGKTVTYSTFTKKPEVTGNVDVKDSGETVTYTTPDKRKKRSDAGQKRVKKDKVIVKEPETQIKTEPQTQTQSDDGGKEPPKKPPTTGESDDGKQGAFSSIKQFARKNPVASLVGYDIGKGILGKIMNAKKAVPGVVGGTVGRRSARGGGGL